MARHNPLQILNEEVSYIDTYRYLGTFNADLKYKKFSLKTLSAPTSDIRMTMCTTMRIILMEQAADVLWSTTAW